MRVRLTGAVCALGLGLGLPAAAYAVGPSPPVKMGGSGAAWAGHGNRFVTRAGGPAATVIVRRGRGGRMTRLLAGRWGIPEVAYDGTTEQVPPGSGAVVLAGRAMPFRRSRFLVLSAGTLRPRRTIVLRGAWAFDALAPDGAKMYLIEHPTRDYTRYEVRALDLRSGRVLPGVIADKRSGEWRMQGLPTTRLERPGAAWSYTLYVGGSDGAFVHALDTANATARCIDLPGLTGDLTGARMRLSGTRLLIVEGGERLAAIDTHTLAVVHARPAAREDAAATAAPGSRWAAALAGVAIVALGAGVVGLRRRMPHNPRRDRQA